MKILVAHDGLLSSDAAIDDMQQAGLPLDAKAFVVCVADAGGRHAAKALADTAGSRIQSHFPRWEVSAEASSGSPAEAILKTSQWWRPDLLIIGSGAFALERSMTSSVPLDVAHRARCSVRVARPGVQTPRRIRLVLGNNGSKACEAVVHEVARRRWPENTDAHVISVVESRLPQGKEQERVRLRAMDGNYINRLRDAGLTVNRRFINGDPREELIQESERCNANAIFVGPRCMPGLARFLLGSVATAVLTRARSTVEVVRQN